MHVNLFQFYPLVISVNWLKPHEDEEINLKKKHKRKIEKREEKE